MPWELLWYTTKTSCKTSFAAVFVLYHRCADCRTVNRNSHFVVGCLSLQKISLRTQKRPRRSCCALDGFSRFYGDHALRHSKARRSASARFMPASKVVFVYLTLRLASGYSCVCYADLAATTEQPVTIGAARLPPGSAFLVDSDYWLQFFLPFF